MRIPESWKFLLVESGILGFGNRNPIQGIHMIPLTIGIRNPSSSVKNWNLPESTVCNPESKTVLDSLKVRKNGQQKTCNLSCNIAIQLVLRQCCKTSCTFFADRFSVPLDGTKEFILERTLGGMSCSHS